MSKNQHIDLNFKPPRFSHRILCKFRNQGDHESAIGDFGEIFSFTFVAGDQNTALTAPNTLVITKSMAQKYFGDEYALGKVITRDNARDFEVTGVIEDIPDNSHLHFPLLTFP